MGQKRQIDLPYFAVLIRERPFGVSLLSRNFFWIFGGHLNQWLHIIQFQILDLRFQIFFNPQFALYNLKCIPFISLGLS